MVYTKLGGEYDYIVFHTGYTSRICLKEMPELMKCFHDDFDKKLGNPPLQLLFVRDTMWSKHYELNDTREFNFDLIAEQYREYLI